MIWEKTKGRVDARICNLVALLPPNVRDAGKGANDLVPDKVLFLVREVVDEVESTTGLAVSSFGQCLGIVDETHAVRKGQFDVHLARYAVLTDRSK